MGNRLLLADDSITIQKVVAIIFANEEFDLTVVDNGVAALEKAREILPDVMLVDALMPGKTGYEVCAEIRRDPKLCSVPILLLIGAFENPDEEEARSCGADASISKPFESQALIDRVKEMLELGKARSSAPAAQPPPVESAAEELWGDLSSFDAMPPVAAPEAPAPAAQPTAGAAQPAEPAFAAPVPAQAASAFTAPQEPSAARPAAFEEDIVEASLEDDLWGAFETEEAPKAAAAAPAPAFAGAEPEAEFEAEEFFSFEDDSEDIVETGPALEAAELVEEPIREPIEEPVEEPIEELVEEPVVLPSDEEPFPVPIPEPQSAPIFQAQGPGAGAGGAQPGAPALSEADLVAALSKISKEVIERIVWEVVPDLAEALIKEEIRKLKAGIRG